ncbi:MAG: tetratricopeptide repeat protein [Thermoplasmata archaeon]|nr:tetratricopeptide repeat protein [Thermoplasmata archaeon]
MVEIPLVDRKKELAFLMERLRAAGEGSGSAVLLKGDTGTGKTRLCLEILFAGAGEGFSPLSGWCVSQSVQPLIAFEDALKGAGLHSLIEEGKPPKIEGIHLFVGNTPVWSIERERIKAEEVGYEKVRNFALKETEKNTGGTDSGVQITRYGNYEVLNVHRGNLAFCCIVYGKVRETLVRDFQEILTAHLDDGNLETVKSRAGDLMRSGKYDGIDWAQGIHDAKKINLFENVLLGIRRFAEKQPVVLFIDDLHLADTVTVELFLYLARNLKNSRILLLGTLNTEAGIIPENWKEILQQIELDQSVETLALGNLSCSEVGEIFCAGTGIKLSEGVENLIYEITGGNPLFVAEYLRHLKENYSFGTERELVRILKSGQLPATLSALVLTRFEKLAKIEREVCTALAILRFGDPHILSKICGYPADKMLQVLSALQNCGILTAQGDIWKFVNSTFAEAIYATLSHTRKVFLHRKALEYLVENSRNDERLFGEILRHGMVLNNKEVILEYGIRAGEAAMSRYSVSEAVEDYMAAMEVSDEQKRREFLPKVLEALEIVSRYGDCIKLIDEELKAALEPVERAGLLRKKAEILIKKGEYSEGMGCAREALQILQSRKEPGESGDLAKVYSVIGVLYERKGQYTDAMRWEGKALQILEKLEGMESTISFVYNRMGVVCWHIGDYKTSEFYYLKGLEIARKKNDMVAMSRCYNNLGVLYRNRGDPAKALEFYLKSLEIDEKIGDRWGIAGTCNNIGIVYHEMGNIPESLNYYNRALEIEKEVGDVWGIALLHNNLGIGYFEMGDLETALEHYEVALKIYERVGDTKGIAIVYNNMGDLHSARGETEAARECYDKSCEMCRRIGALDYLFNPIHGLVEISLSPAALHFCEQKLSELQEITEKLADRKKTTIAISLKARVEAMKGNLDEARTLFQNAERNFEDCRELIDLAKVLYHHGIFEMKVGEKVEARKLLENAREMFSSFNMEGWRKRTELALRTLERETLRK